MEDGEIQKYTEKGSQEIKDTVVLPLTRGEYIHLSTTPSRIAEAFEGFADQLGYDGARAKAFFEEKVECRLGSVDEIPAPYGNRLDDVVSKAISTIKGSKPGGAVVPTKDDKYIFCLDAQAIAKQLPSLKTKSFRVEGYASLTAEQKIAAFQQTVKSFAEHEFFHILQSITDPEDFKKSGQQIMRAQRVFLTWAAVAGTLIKMLPPRLNFPIVTSSGLVTVGAVAYLSRKSVRIEKDAYDVQRKALRLKLKNPFTFTHEPSPKT